MNERIEKISEQARQYADSMYPSGLDIAKWGPAYQEKFAELIVRECLKIVEPTEDSGDEWCVTLKGTAQEIKQHFGVEE
jgi:hypothetical protein